MRSVSICSLECTQLPFGDELIGVDSIPHLGLTLVASTTNLRFIVNGEVTRDVGWSDMDGDGITVVLFGVIEGRAVCVFSSGKISYVDCESGKKEEIMLSIEGEIIAASINPVTCVIVLVLSDHTITFIDPLFEVIVEGIDLKTRERGMDELVTVGWGSEKTQFQGKAGKEEREKEYDCRKGRSDDTRKCQVNWKEDGEVFLVNYYDDDKDERECSIWNGNGQLISRILRERRMEEWSAFKPSGNIIGVASEGRIIMAERNGEMRNGVIRVDEVIDGGRIHDGAWNIDATILLLHIQKKNNNASLSQYLTMWVCSNLDWSCKLILPFEGSNLIWRWNNERWDELMIISPSKDLFILNVSLPFQCWNGIVCTMGNRSLRLTNFNRVIIPPPMAEVYLPLHSPSALFFSSSHLVSIAHDRTLHHYSISSSNSSILSYSLVISFLIDIPSNAIISCIFYLDGEYAVGITFQSIHSLLYFDSDGNLLRKVNICSAVIGMKKEKDESISILLSKPSIMNEVNRIELPTDISHLVDYRFSESGLGLYTLDSCSNLYHNGGIISNEVSSFTYSHPFVAWIDNSFRLHVMDVLSNETADVRPVEKGSRLVSIAPPKLILQMPRGNLETIHARFFVIRSIRSLLSKGEVKTALIQMRKHGISFTLLKDFDHIFSSSIDWLYEMEDVNLLSLVVTELRSLEEYSSYSDLLLNCILSLQSSQVIRLFPCVLTSFLLSKPSRSKEAFRSIVDNLPHDDSRASTLRHWLQVSSFFINPCDIFKSSLSTYDLPFVVEVVEALSIDPNEYMDILRELNQLNDVWYRAYKMDILREDWSSALVSLSRSSPPKLDELIDLINRKSLHSLSLQIYGGQEENDHLFKRMGRLAIDHYSKEGKWKEAALIGRSIGDYEEELKWREKINDVEGWMAAIELSGKGEDERNAKMNEWKNCLKMKSNWETAAILMNHIDCGWEEKMDIREKGRDWKGIAMDIDREKRKKEVSMKGREILQRRTEEMEKDINAKITEIERLSRRLNVVREKKKEMIGRMINGEMRLEDIETCDAFSQSSMSSYRTHSSRSSRVSSMSRRTKKIEKKKSNLREGGEWEDAAILIASHSHWKTLREILNESMVLLPALISLRLFSSLSSLSIVLDRLECTLLRLSPIIWPSRMESHHLTGPLSHIFEDGCISSEGNMPSSFSIDAEMNPPSPLSEKERGWRIFL
ncbi:elpc-1 [Pristionchus pacificus]|nr:elpc-1 [Pristionchus pacificus]